jgi:2-polyprenyl-6-methoxyphenol hydroxylase-like FAD-dependent oxidoreductase
MRRKSVLISGAGIAGPALAYWLLQRGFEPTLIERAPHFREGGYMIDFWGVGYEVADRMKLIQPLRDLGYLIDQVRFVDERNRTRSEFDAGALRRTLADRFFSLPRGDLAKTIFNTVTGEMETIFGDSVVRTHEDAAGIDVEFEHREPSRFDLLVGCDGLHSRIREIAWGSESEFEKYLGYYCASFTTSDFPYRDEQTYTSYAEPGRQISRYALRGGRTAFLLILAREKLFAAHADLSARKAILCDVFKELRWSEIPEILGRLETCDDLYFDSVSQIRMPQWSRGRVGLVGDAAYCPSLLAGEGAGFAMAGGYLLAGELQRANGDHTVAYRAYEKRFRPFLERKQQLAAQFASGFTPKTRLGLLLRDFVLRLSSIPPIGGWLMRRFVTDQLELPNFR